MARLKIRGNDYIIRLLLGFVVAFTLAGCTTLRNGGAPEPSFSYDKDLQDLEALFAPAASIAKIGANPNENDRNSFLDGR